MYEFKTRVRYSEVDEKSELTWSGLVNFFQDTCIFQSEDLELGVDYLAKNHIAWVLNFWQIDVNRFPKLGENITVGTVPYEVKGFKGLRNFIIKNTDTEEVLAMANSIWTLIDTEKLTPARADEKMISSYSVGNKLDMVYEDRKVKLEGEAIKLEGVVVTPHMIDTNHHVNNEQYIELALPYLPDGFNKPMHLRAEYKQSAHLGDVMIPVRYDGSESVGVTFEKPDTGDVYVKCLFR